MRSHAPAFILAILLFSLCFSSSSGEDSLNLQEVVDQALRKNPEILAAKERWEAAKAKIPQVRWWGDPQVGIGYEKIPEGSFSLGEAKMRMYSISQMIPFPGKLTVKGRIAGKDAQIAEETYEAKINQIVAKVKSAYYSLFFIHKAIEINRENKGLIQKFAKIAETKYVVGKASQHDVLKAQVELSLIVDDLITLEHADLPTAEAKLNALLNQPPDSPLGVPEESEIPQLEYAKEEIEALALRERPALKAMGYGVEKSSHALTLARMQYLPNFMFKLSQEHVEMGMGEEVSRGIMVSLNLPLWPWKQTPGVREKRSQKRAMESSYQAIENTVLFEVQNALAQFDASERRVNLFRTSIIPQAEQALKAATIAYETGKVDFLTLINGERGLRDARLKYYRILAKHGTNLANLERVVGVTLSE